MADLAMILHLGLDEMGSMDLDELLYWHDLARERCET